MKKPKKVSKKTGVKKFIKVPKKKLARGKK